MQLTELGLCGGGALEQVECVQHEGHVHRVTSQPLDARHELYRSLKLGGEHEDLEIKERLLVAIEVTLT